MKISKTSLDLKALWTAFKALYAKHFKAVNGESPKPDSFGSVIDKCLIMIDDIEQAQSTLNSNRASLVSLAANIKDCNIMKKIDELAAEAKPVDEDSERSESSESADIMFG